MLLSKKAFKRRPKMVIKESGEMYLETILLLLKKSETVRSIDVAEATGYSKPSVSRAVGILRENRYIDIDDHGYIHLTDLGRKTAEGVYERHTVLTAVLSAVGVDPKIAEDDACKIEHVISDETFSKIKEALSMIQEKCNG